MIAGESRFRIRTNCEQCGSLSEFWYDGPRICRECTGPSLSHMRPRLPPTAVVDGNDRVAIAKAHGWKPHCGNPDCDGTCMDMECRPFVALPDPPPPRVVREGFITVRDRELIALVLTMWWVVAVVYGVLRLLNG